MLVLRAFCNFFRQEQTNGLQEVEGGKLILNFITVYAIELLFHVIYMY